MPIVTNATTLRPRLAVNDQFVGFKTASVVENRNQFNASDSETGEFDAMDNDRRSARFTFSGLRKTTTDPHASPLLITGSGRGTVDVKYWPNGNQAPYESYYWWLPDAKVATYQDDSSGEAAPAGTYTLAGSSGPAGYTTPAETAAL